MPGHTYIQSRSSCAALFPLCLPISSLKRQTCISSSSYFHPLMQIFLSNNICLRFNSWSISAGVTLKILSTDLTNVCICLCTYLSPCPLGCMDVCVFVVERVPRACWPLQSEAVGVTPGSLWSSRAGGFALWLRCDRPRTTRFTPSSHLSDFGFLEGQHTGCAAEYRPCECSQFSFLQIQNGFPVVRSALNVCTRVRHPPVTSVASVVSGHHRSGHVSSANPSPRHC